jgi:hypothetical protein
MQMVEGGERDAADGALRHLGEDAVAQLGEGLRQYPCDTIGEQHVDRHDEGGAWFGRQAIDHALEEDRHIDVGDLGADEKRDRQHDARPQIPVGDRPQMRQELPERRVLAGATPRLETFLFIYSHILTNIAGYEVIRLGKISGHCLSNRMALV